ncbi:hypothetical protein F4861DRAFT_535581 [Xylaria intraflava]|nr:hypothetical protein F4861DRAFT_535581 [Xylaria intraflava]
MPPANQPPGEPARPANSRPPAPTTSTTPALLRFTGAPVHPSQRNDESWVEVSSHPSSSSVSSVGEEIVTTGLHVSSSARLRRRRQQQQQRTAVHVNATQSTGERHTAAGGSSQEEYEESESEEDHFLTSSTENIVSGPPRQTPIRQGLSNQVVDLESSDEDDDENATALGRQPSEPFRPQPNAFSHPPSHLTHRHTTSSSLPQHSRRPSFSRRSHTRFDRRAADFMSPNSQADHDAALRASLSTLLRCAAAARSLPKDGEKELPTRPGPVGGSAQPVALRFAPESELMAPSPPPAPPRGPGQPANTTPPRPSPGAPAAVVGGKAKRAATPPPGSKPPRATKKKRTVPSEDALISPTLLTWVVSAGVVVLVSVVGFGAGYVLGREVGRRETLSSFSGAGNMSAVSEGGNCGREAIRSSGSTLRRLRWGAGMGRSIAA